MPGVHKNPTISFRISDYERREIEAKIKASGMLKKDYFVRSCIYKMSFALFVDCIFHSDADHIGRCKAATFLEYPAEIKRVVIPHRHGNILYSQRGIVSNEVGGH